MRRLYVVSDLKLNNETVTQLRNALNEQQDISECFDAVWGAITTQCLRRFEFVGIERAALRQQSEESALPFVLFGFTLISNVCCRACGNTSTTEERHTSLQLDLPDDVECVSFEELVQAYVAPTSLTGGEQYRCGCCMRLCDADKSLSVNDFSDNFVVVLKRFRYAYEATKVHTHVQLPTSLVLDESDQYGLVSHCFFIPGLFENARRVELQNISATKPDRVIMWLICVAMASGKRYSHEYRMEEQRFSLRSKHDDTKITPESESVALGAQAFLAMYTRQSRTVSSNVVPSYENDSNNIGLDDDDVSTMLEAEALVLLGMREEVAVHVLERTQPTPTATHTERPKRRRRDKQRDEDDQQHDRQVRDEQHDERRQQRDEQQVLQEHDQEQQDEGQQLEHRQSQSKKKRGRRTSLFGNTRPTKSSLLIDEAIDRHADFAAARATITKRETFGLDSLPMMLEIRVQLTSNAVAVIELQHSNAFSIKAG